MTTNFPDALDTTWQDPLGTEDLSTSPDGRSHAGHHTDVADVVLAMENQLVGPAFSSASAFATVAASAPLSGGGDCEATTGWTVANGINLLTSTTHSEGTKSVSLGGCKIGYNVNLGLTTAAHLNLTADVPRGTRSHLSIDLRWGTTSFNAIDLATYFEWVVADGVNLTGNTVTFPPSYADESVWVENRIPIMTLTKVRSIGIRTIAPFLTSHNASINLLVDNIRFSAQTPLEAALAAHPVGGVVVVPGSYDATGQELLTLSEGQFVIDQRADFGRVRGERDIRDFQIPLDGTTDVTADLQTIFSWLRPGDRLVFPRNYRFLFSSGMTLTGLEDVEIDFNGCKLYAQQPDIAGSVLSIMDCRRLKIGNVRLYGYYEVTDVGDAMDVLAGTPSFPGGGVVQLTSKDDAVYINGPINHGLTVDDEIPFDFTVRQSGAQTYDLRFEVVDSDAPSTAMTATPTGTEGGLGPGTYYYCCTFFDIDGRETSPSPRTAITLAVGSAVTLSNIPVVADDPRYVSRKIYRSDAADMPDDPRAFSYVATIYDQTTTTFYDNQSSGVSNFRPNIVITGLQGAAGNVGVGNYTYTYSAVLTTGHETSPSLGSARIAVTGSAKRVNLTVPVASGAGFTVGMVSKRKIYRTLADAAPNTILSYHYVGTINDNSTTAYVDNVADDPSAAYPVMAGPSSTTPPRVLEVSHATPAAQDGTVRFVWKPQDQRRDPKIVLRKVTNAVNTITITDVTTYTKVRFLDTYETSSGINVGGTSTDVEVHDVFATLMGSDAVTTPGAGQMTRIAFRRIYSYGNRRQGASFNGGKQITFEDSKLFHSGRSGLDIEPYSDPTIDGVWVSNILIYDCPNYGVAAENWFKIRNIHWRDITVYGCPGLSGGGQMGEITNFTSWWGGVLLKGQGIYVSNISAQLFHAHDDPRAPDGLQTLDTGGHLIQNVRLLTDDYVDASTNSITVPNSIYLVAPPGATPSITVLA